MAVYKFRVKLNGSFGRVNLISGMNVEIVDDSRCDTPWNTNVEKLFVQEFAKKYQIKDDIRGLFSKNSLDVEEL